MSVAVIIRGRLVPRDPMSASDDFLVTGGVDRDKSSFDKVSICSYVTGKSCGRLYMPRTAMVGLRSSGELDGFSVSGDVMGCVTKG